MFDRAEFDRWRDMALDAAATADQQIMREGHHWACFLAEQAGQFICKGLLHGLGLPAWGHDLVDLGARIRAEGGLDVDAQVTDALVRLSRHYIATRYPDAHPSGTPSAHYGRADAEQAVLDARRIISFVDEQWSRLLEETEQVSGSDGEPDAE